MTGSPPAPARVVCLGASAGGPAALRRVFAGLPAATPAAVLVAQHMPEGFTRAFAARLGDAGGLAVHEATDGMAVQPGHAYVAPGGHHLRLCRGEAGLSCAVSVAAAADHYVPSVDALFDSAAAAVGPALLAAVLTGMGTDGSRGAVAVQAAGGRVLAEARESAAIFGMPQQAQQTGAVDALLPLPALVARLRAFMHGA